MDPCPERLSSGLKTTPFRVNLTINKTGYRLVCYMNVVISLKGHRDLCFILNDSVGFYIAQRSQTVWINEAPLEVIDTERYI